MIPDASNRFRVLDAFAGAGGFSLGFAQAGCSIVGAIECDTWACETFSLNHPRSTVVRDDISNLSDSDIIDRFLPLAPDVLIGGPPCQGFSIANRQSKDPKDPRNSLFNEFVRAARLLNPSVVVMENVPNLLAARTQDRTPVIEIIEDALQALGYNVYVDVLRAPEFGIPQLRTRLFVIGSKEPLKHPFPSPTHSWAGENATVDLFDDGRPICPSLWDAISDLPPLDAGQGAEVSAYTAPPFTEYQQLMRGRETRLYNHKAMNHTPRMVERFRSMVSGQTGNDVPDHLKPRRRNSQLLAETAYDQNNRRMHPDRPCHTIPASFYANFVHPHQHRNFTAREGARIQSFPDSFRFCGKPTVVSHKLLAREGRHAEKYLCQYAQIGNAVPPILAKALAENLLLQLRKPKARHVRSRKQSVPEGIPSC